MNKKIKSILGSVVIIAIVATLTTIGTQSFFSDIETSTGNTFTAGTIDLKIDCNSKWYDAAGNERGSIYFDEKDLIKGEDKFFDWDDIKPGDHGEMTISIHVYDNDAWGWIHLMDVEDNDNGLTEPEEAAGDATGGDGEGELSQYLQFRIWDDWGADDIPGTDDEGEGDNIWQDYEYVEFEGSAAELASYECKWMGPFKLEACVTYYFGVAWWLPSDTGNIVQSDSFSFGIEFYVEQFINNPNPSPPAGDAT